MGDGSAVLCQWAVRSHTAALLQWHPRLTTALPWRRHKQVSRGGEAPGRCLIFSNHGLLCTTVFLSDPATCNAEQRGWGRAAMGCEALGGAKHGLTEVFVARLRIAALRWRLTQGAPNHPSLLPTVAYFHVLTEPGVSNAALECSYMMQYEGFARSMQKQRNKSLSVQHQHGMKSLYSVAYTAFVCTCSCFYCFQSALASWTTTPYTVNTKLICLPHFSVPCTVATMRISYKAVWYRVSHLYFPIH